VNLAFYDAHWRTLGGGEKYLAALAEALSERHKTTLILDGIGRSDIEARMGHPLDTVTTRYGDGYGASVVLSNVLPWGKKPCYVVQIPYGPIGLRKIGRSFVLGRLREGMKDVFRKKMLKCARNSHIVLVYSNFVKNELKKHHNIDATVLYPPVEDMASTTPKRKTILSVGRFFDGPYNKKRFDVLIEAFKIFSQRKPDWNYAIVGGAEDSEMPYVKTLLEQTKGYPISIQVNIAHEELKQFYGEATLFWSATGYEATGPEECEGFGIAIVEAMSAGCIPIVHDSGGPREIIQEHGCGYLWQSPEQLARISANLTPRGPLIDVLAMNARERYKDFSVEKFRDNAISIFSKLEVL
jgi:glycosyltransferase involved in cell wall biosynthesis